MRHRRLAPAVLASVLASLLALSVLGGPGLVGAASARPASEPVRIKPDQLTRGADPAVPHVDGTTLVDGAVTVDIGTARPVFLARSGADYLVHAMDDMGVGPVLRVTAAGVRTTVVTPAKRGDVVLASADGALLAQARPKGDLSTTKLTVWSSSDGAVVASKAYPGLVSILDLDAQRAVVGGPSDTTSWTMSSGLVRKIVKRAGYHADLAADRLATFTGDPYDGGCTVVSSLSAPTKALWRSCTLRVERFSPDGKRTAAVDLLADGLGPGVVVVVDRRGRTRSTYGIRGYFGLVTWESPTALLLEAYGRKQSALVRCTAGTCERASEVFPTPPI